MPQIKCPTERRGLAALAIIAISATSVAGCNFAPAYTPPTLTLPAAYKEIGPWAEAQPSDAAPRGDWWLAFNDPMLNSLEGQVVPANPTLAAALASYDRSRALAAQARSDLFPTVTGIDSNSYNRQSADRPLRGVGQSNEYANNQVGAEVSYELDFWGRVRNLVASGEAQAQASAADLTTARLSLQVELADDYLSLRGLDQQTKLLNDTVAAYSRALELTQDRHNGGVSSGLDVDRASTQLSSAKAQVSDVAAQRALFEHAIASLVGQPASSFTIAPAVLDLPIPVEPAGVPSVLLQRRADIAAAERRAYSANRLIGVARAAYYPTVSLNAQGGWQNAGGNNLLSSPDSFWTIGPQLAMTLFDGGRRKADVAEAKANFHKASADYRATVLSAFQQVEDEMALSNHLADEAQDQASAVKSAEATTDLSMIRYREGATDYLDVVVAQTAELQVEQGAIGIETRRQQASVDLVRALGGGWTSKDLPHFKGAAHGEVQPKKS